MKMGLSQEGHYTLRIFLASITVILFTAVCAITITMYRIEALKHPIKIESSVSYDRNVNIERGESDE